MTPRAAEQEESPAVCLARAQQLVDKALLYAQANEWNHVAELDQQCRAAIEALVTHHQPIDLAPLLDPLNYLLKCHRHLLELAETERTAIVDARRQSIHARHSVKIYES